MCHICIEVNKYHAQNMSILIATIQPFLLVQHKRDGVDNDGTHDNFGIGRFTSSRDSVHALMLSSLYRSCCCKLCYAVLHYGNNKK